MSNKKITVVRKISGFETHEDAFNYLRKYELNTRFDNCIVEEKLKKNGEYKYVVSLISHYDTPDEYGEKRFAIDDK